MGICFTSVSFQLKNCQSTNLGLHSYNDSSSHLTFRVELVRQEEVSSSPPAFIVARDQLKIGKGLCQCSCNDSSEPQSDISIAISHQTGNLNSRSFFLLLPYFQQDLRCSRGESERVRQLGGLGVEVGSEEAGTWKIEKPRVYLLLKERYRKR